MVGSEGARMLNESTARAAAAADPLQRAYLLACFDELQAPKPGNVSVYSAGHGMTAQDFARSAEASAAALCDVRSTLGERVLGAIRATSAVAGCNTNLGIVLLAAPLLMAAQQTQSTSELRGALARVLGALTVDDSERVFEAIRLASPAGLGKTESHDVHQPARAALGEVMTSAAEHDRIARQYAHNFADVFGLGVPALAQATQQYRSRKWQVVALYLALLAWVPDTHIHRKFGEDVALSVQKEARQVRERAQQAGEGSDALGLLRDFDARLKAGGINPGTTADLTVATLLIARLAARSPQEVSPQS